MHGGGSLALLDAATGGWLTQGRLKGALDFYYSSPVGADRKIFTSSEDGHVSVIRAGADWDVLAVNDMNEPVYATPAPVDQQLYLRTRNTLYCFGKTAPTVEHAETGARD